jgi:hypothetical protein
MTDLPTRKEEYRARVFNGKQIVAQAFGSDCEAVWREGEHYLRQYSRDGATELQVSVKQNKRWKLLGGNVVATFGKARP